MVFDTSKVINLVYYYIKGIKKKKKKWYHLLLNKNKINGKYSWRWKSKMGQKLKENWSNSNKINLNNAML